MKKYLEIVFRELSSETSDILVARLTEAGFYGFLEEEGSLKAYILPENLDRAQLNTIAEACDAGYQSTLIAEENWNADWESSFEPVRVGKFVAVRADFHTSVEDVEHEIIITPKMSFGTGHHATTWLMIRAMEGMVHPGDEFFDFGTGTGVLAILAAKMRAGKVLAVDNDPWSMENAAENVSRNGVSMVELQLSDSVPGSGKFDLVLANINKHILLANCRHICEVVKPGGRLLLSGILPSDVMDMEEAFGLYMGKPVIVEERNNWSLMAFTKRFAP